MFHIKEAKMKNNTRKMVFVSLMVAQALVLHIIERALPVPFVAPGVKLGLANIITLVCLYTLDFKGTFSVVMVRLLLSTFLGGNLSSLLYSAAGAFLSLIFMYLVMRIGKKEVSLIGVSIVGAVFHNVGQVTVAAFMIQNVNIVIYLPILLVSAIGTGIFVGLTSKYMLSALEKIRFIKEINWINK
jgi:heptaprenyl diphosphate synthase